ncbi:MAG TPA: hypothetical protein VE110_08270 [Gemmatimonadaceae bacterium]|nr:hypothetical protein [Gemmatimonadaceae bacterium]
MSKTYATLVSGVLCILVASRAVNAQQTANTDDGQTCATLLSGDSTTGTRVGPSDSTTRSPDSATRSLDTTRSRADSASFGIGGARNGAADVMLLVGVHADQVTFASQPHVRVRLCFGGDTLRILQRDNLPSPVVAGPTYRNVYVAVQLIGRVNAECLADRLGIRSSAQTSQTNPAATMPSSAASATQCAFLGGTAGTGAQSARPPTP